MNWFICHSTLNPKLYIKVTSFSWSSGSASSLVAATTAYGRTQPRAVRVRRLHRSSTLSRRQRWILRILKPTLTRCILSVKWKSSLETWKYRVYRTESTEYSDQGVQTENGVQSTLIAEVQVRSNRRYMYSTFVCIKKKFVKTYQHGI